MESKRLKIPRGPAVYYRYPLLTAPLDGRFNQVANLAGDGQNKTNKCL